MADKKMQFGVMQRGVFDWDENMPARFDELMEQARLLNELGYDSITKGSHFSTWPHREMTQIPYLCRVMAEAPNVRLNAGIVLLALHNPLEVAEYFATMDLMSKGRVIFGLALGYREVEFKGFGEFADCRVVASRLQQCLGFPEQSRRFLGVRIVGNRRRLRGF